MVETTGLVSVGLPVRNGADRIAGVVKSILAQDHTDLELVICDNASTDGTEDLCRSLAAQDDRIVYRRHGSNIGLHNNFVSAMQLASGEYFRWIGDDDWLAPSCLSRSVEVFRDHPDVILVTGQIDYTDPNGVTRSAPYYGTALGSSDPGVRFAEMLRLLNDSHLLIDPLYGLFRRREVVAIERRNMLYEDQIFATKVALAGRWAHVNEVLARRNFKHESLRQLARKLDVPEWQARCPSLLQSVEILRWLQRSDLDHSQLVRARREVGRFYVRRHRAIVERRARKLGRIAQEHRVLVPAR
jgi:glycosyltransferase involved in cell wall biosynthesis